MSPAGARQGVGTRRKRCAKRQGEPDRPQTAVHADVKAVEGARRPTPE